MLSPDLATYHDNELASALLLQPVTAMLSVGVPLTVSLSVPLLVPLSRATEVIVPVGAATLTHALPFHASIWPLETLVRVTSPILESVFATAFHAPVPEFLSVAEESNTSMESALGLLLQEESVSFRS